MSSSEATRKRIVEHVLKSDGALQLSMLLELMASVDAMRALAQKLGVTPKGGFRLEKAPARVLARALAETREAKQLSEVLGLLEIASASGDAVGDQRGKGQCGGDASALQELRSLLQLRDQETVRLRDELERAREGQVRGRDRATEAERELDSAREQLQLARREAERLRDRDDPPLVASDDKELRHQLHHLEQELVGMQEADHALRRQLARDRSRVRELEDEIAELEALIPPANRRKRRPMAPAAEPAANRRFLVPHLLPSFYKSMVGKDRRAVERALHALLLFCTEGHGYPGLEVKQLGGQDTWSLRASLGLRIYFRPRPDGDIEVLELGDREDQNTTLRRLKER